MSSRCSCVDLFCGAGGLSYGFEHAGFHVLLGVDTDSSALLTFQQNHTTSLVLKEDVFHLTGDQIKAKAGGHEIVGLIGGPPCQGFSVAGKNDPQDVRNQLPYEYARLLKELQPQFFLMENVKGLLNKRQRPHFEALLILFKEAGYHLHWKLLNAWDYGVAQTRQRIFMIGFRHDLEIDFKWPEQDPSRPVLKDVIGDLPEPLPVDHNIPNHGLPNLRPKFMERKIRKEENGSSLYGCRVMDWDKPSATIMASMAKNVDLAHPGTPSNHHGHCFDNVCLDSNYPQANRFSIWDKPSHTITALSRSIGLHPNHGPIPKDEGRILELVSHADPNGVIPLEMLRKVLPSRMNWLKGRQKVGAWHKPNPTITASSTFYTGAHFHPDTAKPRRFTVRECARIQSFPDSFVFYGSLSAQYRQVGNAVPPRLAYYLAQSIASAFRNRK